LTAHPLFATATIAAADGALAADGVGGGAAHASVAADVTVAIAVVIVVAFLTVRSSSPWWPLSC